MRRKLLYMARHLLEYWPNYRLYIVIDLPIQRFAAGAQKTSAIATAGRLSLQTGQKLGVQVKKSGAELLLAFHHRAALGNGSVQ